MVASLIGRAVRRAVAEANGDVDRALESLANWGRGLPDEARHAVMLELRPYVSECPLVIAREVDRVCSLGLDEATTDRLLDERLDGREWPELRAELESQVAEVCARALRALVEAEALAWRSRSA